MNHQDGTQYFNMAWEHLRFPEIVQGLIKPLFFGYILSSIGCFYGMRTTGGTQGVGRSTIQAVVTSSVLIIFVDFIITRLLHQHLCGMDLNSPAVRSSLEPAPKAANQTRCWLSPTLRWHSTVHRSCKTLHSPWLRSKPASCSDLPELARASS